jgi:hypothetical protein
VEDLTVVAAAIEASAARERAARAAERDAARHAAQVAEAAAAGGSLLGRIGRALVEHPWYASGTGAVDGDKLSGSVKAGSFGSFPFTGNRTA